MFDKAEQTEVTQKRLQKELQTLDEQLSKVSGEDADKIEIRMYQIRQQLDNLSEQRKKVNWEY